MAFSSLHAKNYIATVVDATTRKTGAQKSSKIEVALNLRIIFKSALLQCVLAWVASGTNRAYYVITGQKQQRYQELATLALIKSMAWNLLSFRPEFGRNPGFVPASPVRVHPADQPLSILLNLGDSHGNDGRRGLENGERQRSQIR
jgi:hypothetical protein